MCGRYLFNPITGELDEYYKIALGMGPAKQGEVFPSEQVITLGSGEDQKMRLAFTRWGFSHPKTKQLIINARSETVQEKPTFAPSFANKRCLFPMTGFYEWGADKQKYLFTSSDEGPLYVAGLYRLVADRVESVILTTEPNDLVAPIHNRMPLIIPKDAIRGWLNDLATAEGLLAKTDTTSLVITAA